MGESETVEWVGEMEASFDAAVARDEDIAAADLAFSLRQDVDVREAVRRSGTAWALLEPDGARPPVDEVGLDYVRAGALLVRSTAATLRSVPGSSPRSTDATLLEVLGDLCRRGAGVTVNGTSGRLVRVAKEHLGIGREGTETIVGLAAVTSVRLDDEDGYSASRGFSG